MLIIYLYLFTFYAKHRKDSSEAVTEFYSVTFCNSVILVRLYEWIPKAVLCGYYGEPHQAKCDVGKSCRRYFESSKPKSITANGKGQLGKGSHTICVSGLQPSNNKLSTADRETRHWLRTTRSPAQAGRLSWIGFVCRHCSWTEAAHISLVSIRGYVILENKTTADNIATLCYSYLEGITIMNILKIGCIEFKYYADGIHSCLTPPG